VVCEEVLDSLRHGGQRLLPVHFLPLPVDLEHGLGKAIRGIEAFIGVAVAVGEPAFVQLLVLQRQHPHDFVRHHLHDQVRARLSCGLTDFLRASSQVRAL